MRQRRGEHRDKERKWRRGRRGRTARGASMAESGGREASFVNNDRKKRSEKQLSERLDLAQLYFCGKRFEGSVAPAALANLSNGFPALTGWANVCRTYGAGLG